MTEHDAEQAARVLSAQPSTLYQLQARMPESDKGNLETLMAFAVPDAIGQEVAQVLQAWSEVMLQRVEGCGWGGGGVVHHHVGIKPVVL